MRMCEFVFDCFLLFFVVVVVVVVVGLFFVFNIHSRLVLTF